MYVRLLVLLLWCLLLWWSESGSQAATYYVSVNTGNDSNNGSEAAPYKTLKRGTQSPTAPGDTIIVKAGTYTAANQGEGGGGPVLYLSTNRSSVAGTSAAPITLKSEVPLGAVIKVPNTPGTGGSGIYITQPWWIIEGFDINSIGVTQNTLNNGSSGITVVASNVTLRRNRIHDIAKDMCSDTAYGQAGVLIGNGSVNTLVEYNIFSNIGRLRQGESGCAFDRYQHDHGIYNAGGDNTIVRRNVFYGVDRGYSYHDYANGTDHLNNLVEHNTFDTTNPDTRLNGTMIQCQLVSGSVFRNNAFHRPPHGYANAWCAGTTAVNWLFTTNITNTQDETGTIDMLHPVAMPTSGVTATGGLFNKTLGFVSTTAGSEDYSLTSSSQAIDVGLATGQPTCGSGPDIGAFERCGPPSSATITGTTIEVNIPVAFPPIQVPSSTGWSLSCSGAGCGTAAVGSVTRKSGSDSIVSINVTGLPGGNCSAGDTYTVTYNSATGGMTDSINIGYFMNQKLASITAFAVTNLCSGAPPTPPAGFIAYYPLNGNVQDSSGNGNHATQNGGSFVTAKYGQGFKTTNGFDQSFTIPYGNGVNIGTQNITLEMPVFVEASDVGLIRNYMGTTAGTSQRLYVLSRDGTWGVVVQDDGGGWVASDLAVTPGWNHLVLRIDASTNTATLCKNGVTGTSGFAVNTYTDHTLPSNIYIGNPPGFLGSAAGTGIYDEVRIFTSLESCTSLWNAWEPPTAPTSAVLNQVAHRFQAVRTYKGAINNFGTGINQTQKVVKTGAVAILFQLDCANVATCTDTSTQLRYSLDGVNFNQVVPDTPTADGVYMWGEDADAKLNRFGANCPPISGGLTCGSGMTILTSQASPSVNLTQNTSYLLRYIVRFKNPPVSTVYFKLYNQNGSPLSGTYTPSTGAAVTLVKPQAGAF